MSLTILLLIVLCAASLRLFSLLRRRAARRKRFKRIQRFRMAKRVLLLPYRGIGNDLVPLEAKEKLIRLRALNEVLCNPNL